jgi:hypothetical protein
MAIALVWAPANNVFCLYSLALGQEVSLSVVAFFSMAVNFMSAWMTGFAISSATLHLLGALFGAAIAVWMFKTGRVECEGYDLFAVVGGYAGDENRKPAKYVSENEKVQIEQKRQLENQRRDQQWKQNLEKLACYFDDGHIEMGLMRLKTMQRERPDLQLDLTHLNTSIRFFISRHEWSKAIPLLRESIERFPEDRNDKRLTLARMVVVAEKSPRAGIKILSLIDRDLLSAESKVLFKKIYRLAKKQIEAGDIEIGDQ